MGVALTAGAETLDACMSTLEALGVTGNCAVTMLAEADVPSMMYKDGDIRIAEAIARLRDTSAASILIRPIAQDLEFVIIFRPYFDGASRPWWTITIEVTDCGERLFSRLLSTSELLFIALTEDSLEVPDLVTEQSFPWDDWQLIVGAVKTHSGWAIRRGPAANHPQEE